METIMAVDIGGSKTLLCLYDMNNKEIDTFYTDGVGLATESDDVDAFPKLNKILNEITAKYSVCSIAVNLGGKNKGQITAIFKRYFPKATLSVQRESEGMAALAFGEAYNSEVVILAGTGTIATATDNDGKFVVAGGWGCNIGDGGSGYDTGLEAIRQSLKELDENKELSMLAKEITGLDKPFPRMSEITNFCDLRDGVRSRLSPLDRKNIASFTKVVASCCDKGDETSRKILEEAGRRIGKLAVDAAFKLGCERLNGIAVSGGLVNIRKYWGGTFEEYVRCHIAVDNFNYVADGVLVGTYEIAKKQIGTEKR